MPGISMKRCNLFFLGFGTIGRALARLLIEKQGMVRESYGASFPVVGVATRRHGWTADSTGVNLDEVLRSAESGAAVGSKLTEAADLESLLKGSRADVLVELTPTGRENGEPAVTHIRTALRSGLHAVTANKGPVAYAYRELRDLADSAGRRFLFESTVMDGTPLFSLQREALPAARILGFRAVLNSTTNYLLGRMEEGMDFEEAVGAAQAVGIAETDPMVDVEGWDSVLKVAALVNVWMDYPLRPSEIAREGISGLSPAGVRRARAEGRPFKLVCRAARTAEGITASVRPEQVAADDPLASVGGTGTMLCLESDVLPGLIIGGAGPSPRTTACGLLSDLLRIARGDSSPLSSPF
jgi:homoserine dehydrogenase